MIQTNNLKVKSLVTVEQEKITVKSVGIKKEFSVDRVFDQGSTQGNLSLVKFVFLFCSMIHFTMVYAEDVFQEVKPILRSALDGHNVCILAYGQTGTGKTYTMVGWCLF